MNLLNLQVGFIGFKGRSGGGWGYVVRVSLRWIFRNPTVERAFSEAFMLQQPKFQP